MNEPEADEYVRTLFVSWYPAAVRCAFRRCGSLESAEDVVQDAFRQLFLALVNGCKVENAKAWTFKVIQREIARNHRAEIQRSESLEPTEILDLRPALGPRTDSFIDNDELTRLLALLTVREEEVLLLRMQGFRYQEIGSALHISLNSVKTLLARALRKLHDNATATGSNEMPRSNGRLVRSRKYVTKTLN
jgi:RNA polymerase sigma-70 factor (ECF subfamily)